MTHSWDMSFLRPRHCQVSTIIKDKQQYDVKTEFRISNVWTIFVESSYSKAMLSVRREEHRCCDKFGQAKNVG